MEESTVKLIFETDEFGGANFAKKYPSLYEKQRLLLKSLYDIRRYRLNNKDVNLALLFYFILKILILKLKFRL